MKTHRYSLILMLTLLTSGCERIQKTLHLLPNQDEQQCLDSERMNFKDPEVLFVANLGDRGLGANADQYWVRYKAKNSYGAFLQGNMLCKKDFTTKEWKRDFNGEYAISVQITAELLTQNRLKQRDPNYVNRFPYTGVDGSPENAAEKVAKELMFSSPNTLADYAQTK